MERVDVQFLQSWEVDLSNTTAEGENREYVLNEVTFDDGSIKYEVDIEVDGVAGSFELEMFDTEKEARDYIANQHDVILN